MADRYWVGGDGDWDATAGTKWALTSGGAGGQAVPTSSDAVYLDNGTGHGSVTVTATANCASLTCTGYEHTLTVNAALNVYGNITLEGTAMTSAGSSVMIGMASGTWTSDGHQWGARLSARGTSQVYSLADAWVITGAFDSSGTSPTLSNSTLSAVGLAVNSPLSGSTNITLTGGTWSGTSALSNNLTLAGNVTVSGVVSLATSTLTYSSGTITTTGSTLGVNGAATLNTNGVTWATVKFNSSTNITLNSLLSASTIEFADKGVTIQGTAGFTCGTLQNATITAATKTFTLTRTNTYTVTTALTLAGASSSIRVALESSDGALKVPFVCSASSPTLSYVNATRIDSSGGNPIYTTGDITDCTNWSAPPSTGTVSAVFNVTP